MKRKNISILVTGAAGFIGSSLAIKLLDEKINVIGVDNLNDYYSIILKKDRLKNIEQKRGSSMYWKFHEISIENQSDVFELFKLYNPDIVINLAAQAGVRYSLENPNAYIKSNLVGFFNIVEACREFNVENFIYASSSSVYGGNKKFPFKETDSSNHPISLYAATKRSNELIAHSYSHLYGIPMTGLRFFTVYGPWGRPDMAPIIFAKAILEEKPISIFNFGSMIRDFTYIDDVVEAISRCCFKKATASESFQPLNPDPSISFAKHRIFNVGNSKPLDLELFIKLLEKNLGKKAIKKYEELQPGDIIATNSDSNLLKEWIGFQPSTTIEEGMKKFSAWVKDYYQLN